MFDRCHWLNEPARWSLDAGRLDVVTDAATDFWQKTHYGFARDSGHFFGAATEGRLYRRAEGRGFLRNLVRPGRHDDARRRPKTG